MTKQMCIRDSVGVVEDARHHLREFPGRLSGTLYVLAGAQSPVLARVADVYKRQIPNIKDKTQLPADVEQNLSQKELRRYKNE